MTIEQIKEKMVARFKELSGDVSANSDASLRMVLDEFEEEIKRIEKLE